MNLKTVTIADLKPHPDNPNTHPAKQVDALVDSLNKFDQVKNVVIWNNRIIAGHGVVEAAKKAGLLTLEAQDISHWDEAKATEFMLADIRLPDMGIFDEAAMAEALRHIDEPLDIPGFDEAFLARIGLEDGAKKEPEPPPIDKAAELQVEYGTEVGQVWTLGRHRLAVGDCTDRGVVEGVMRGEKADLIFTSPPYNRGTTTGGGFPDKGGLWEGAEIASGYNSYDDAMPLEEYRNWQKGLLLFWWDLLANNGAIYYNHRPRVQNGLLETPLDWNPSLPLRQIIIWHSGSGINFAPTHYRPACEWIVIYAKADFRLSSKGESGIGDVWKFGAETDNSHPVPFPLELPFTAIQTSGATIILDPFLGSGTTLIACENLGRRCRGIEIDPGYAAVTLQRFLDHTSIKPELIK